MSLVEFEEWFEGNESKFEYPRLAHKSAKQVWNYLQGEVDKLQTEIDELQARIDEALKELELITCYRTGNSDNAINILKGNKDEN